MTNLDDYLKERGITAVQMAKAEELTQAYIDAYNLREARKANHMTQVELAKAMGVSQNRVSRMENGDINAMSVETLRKYIEALGGRMSLVADLPTGKVSLA
ncbi:MAG: helix-turn-helix transcriptional regulator [Cloacibacillus sp.]